MHAVADIDERVSEFRSPAQLLARVHRRQQQVGRGEASLTGGARRTECRIELGGLRREIENSLLDPGTGRLQAGVACISQPSRPVDDYLRDTLDPAAGGNADMYK